MNYLEFIKKKSQLDTGKGFEPLFMPLHLFDFQKHLVDWALKLGRAAIFADCGMGKTPMQLVFADNCIAETNKPALILAPLSVSKQTVEEAEKFQIDAVRCMDGKIKGKRIHVTNYEKLNYFDPSDFSCVVCDESSIIKNFKGSRKNEITDFMKKIKYRLLCTATASPNDYIELGTSSEALGYLGYMDMLSTFFKNDEDSLHPAFLGSKWRFKMHAQNSFWRWMSSWARAIRRPSDCGFDDKNFVLPKLFENEHYVDSPVLEGNFFAVPAVGLTEQREDSKATIVSRCEKAAELTEGKNSSISWCHLNAESSLLKELIPDSQEVKGSDKDEKKEELFDAFRHGELKRLITKPKIAAFGMNWQHCSHMTYFPTHSYEQYYQAVRRCWRFGQENDVTVDIVTSESQKSVFQNMKRKSIACDVMFDELVNHMNDAISIDRMNHFFKKPKKPNWL